jgi:hypothetical protein
VDRAGTADLKTRRFDETRFISHCNAAVDKKSLSNGK